MGLGFQVINSSYGYKTKEALLQHERRTASQFLFSYVSLTTEYEKVPIYDTLKAEIKALKIQA